MEPEATQEKEYMTATIQQINRYINCQQYNRAFALLLLFLDRLDDKNKNKVVKHYLERMTELGML